MEMILYDVVLLKVFCVQIIFFKSYPYCFYSLPEIETIRPFVYMCRPTHCTVIKLIIINLGL